MRGLIDHEMPCWNTKRIKRISDKIRTCQSCVYRKKDCAIVDAWIHWNVGLVEKWSVGHCMNLLFMCWKRKVLLHESTLSRKERKWNCVAVDRWKYTCRQERLFDMSITLEANKGIYMPLRIRHMHHKPIWMILSSSSRFMPTTLIKNKTTLMQLAKW